MADEREDRKEFENQVIFMDTPLIQKAVVELQKSREEFQSFLEQAELGDSAACYEVGVRYAEGDGTDKDMEKAAHWFAQSAEQGEDRAQGALGRCYQIASGGEDGKSRALEQ